MAGEEASAYQLLQLQASNKLKVFASLSGSSPNTELLTSNRRYSSAATR